MSLDYGVHFCYGFRFIYSLLERHFSFSEYFVLSVNFFGNFGHALAFL
jgi:hypothetical protein